MGGATGDLDARGYGSVVLMCSCSYGLYPLTTRYAGGSSEGIGGGTARGGGGAAYCGDAGGDEPVLAGGAASLELAVPCAQLAWRMEGPLTRLTEALLLRTPPPKAHSAGRSPRQQPIEPISMRRRQRAQLGRLSPTRRRCRPALYRRSELFP